MRIKGRNIEEGIHFTARGRSFPWALIGQQPFAALWHSGATCNLKPFPKNKTKKGAFWITKWSLWTKGTFKGQPLQLGNYTLRHKHYKSHHLQRREWKGRGRGSPCWLLYKWLRPLISAWLDAIMPPFSLCFLYRRSVSTSAPELQFQLWIHKKVDKNEDYGCEASGGRE